MTVNKHIAAVGVWAAAVAISSTVSAAESPLKITVLYDNYVSSPDCAADWGFACLVTGTEKSILFDTGGKGEMLLGNFEKTKLSPNDVDLVVISHNHSDHTGGLLPFMEKNHRVSVYLPVATPASFVTRCQAQASSVTVVAKPMEVCKGVHVIGPAGDETVEQALAIDTERGLVIVTGCSHPGVCVLAEMAKRQLHRGVSTILGGTHLLRHSDDQLQQEIDGLKKLGVRRIGAIHCSGETAMAKLKVAFGDGFIPMGVGRVIDIGSQ